MSKILNVLKKKWMLFLLLAALFCIFLYLFVPRNLGTLADIHDADIQKITLYGVFLDDKEGDLIIELTETEQQKFLEMMKKTYVFRNPIDKEYTEDDFGYFFELARKPVNRDTVPLSCIISQRTSSPWTMFSTASMAMPLRNGSRSLWIEIEYEKCTREGAFLFFIRFVSKMFQ